MVSAAHAMRTGTYLYLQGGTYDRTSSVWQNSSMLIAADDRRICAYSPASDHFLVRIRPSYTWYL